MSNWYVSENDAWYAPLQQEEKQQAAPEKAKKKMRGWLKAVIAVAVVVALIVASALLFPNRNGSPAALPLPSADSGDSGGNDSPFGQFILPPDGSKDSNDDGSLPDDFKDFFDSFYTAVEDSRTVINIERTELPKGFVLSVEPAGRELTLQEIYRSCSPSIVAISGYENGKSGYNWGTGIVLSEDGLILTNTHVIADCDRATVTLGDDTVYDAKLVGADSISDIAVLKIEAKGLVPAVFGDSTVLEVGDRVAAIGNPLGEEFRLTLTDGIISAIERGVNYKGRSMSLLQTNTAINEGNSGGPLLNMYGQVIGITNMKMMSSYSNIEGIGFAIPSATVVKIVNTLVKEGIVNGRPSIGITVGPIPDEAMERYNMPPGLYISAVTENSDAAAKGLREGDVITMVDGVAVTATSELQAMKDALSVGDTMTFTIWRDEDGDGEGELFDVDVMLVDTNDVYG